MIGIKIADRKKFQQNNDRPRKPVAPPEQIRRRLYITAPANLLLHADAATRAKSYKVADRARKERALSQLNITLLPRVA